MIDLHCHLDLYPKPAAVIAEVNRRNMFVLAVTTTPAAFEGNLRWIGDSKRIRVAVGLHPELVDDRHGEVGLVCSLMKRTRYVGEVGLDGSPDHKETMPIQIKVLRRILEACRSEGGKTISLHSRMAAGLVLDEIETAGAVGTPVLHWFSGTADELTRAVRLNCWFSVGPAMMASRRGRELAASIPIDRLLPESDGPFGKLKGRSLYPWEAENIVPALCEIWSMQVDEVHGRLMSNLRTLVQ